MITALNFTDYLYPPRLVFNQAAHQVDIVRLLAGGRAPGRPDEGAERAAVLVADERAELGQARACRACDAGSWMFVSHMPRARRRRTELAKIVL